MLTTNDLMTIDPDVVTPDTALREVVVLMNAHRHRQILVAENDRLVGIITDRDIRLVANSPLLNNEPLERIELLNNHTVSECMTRNLTAVTPETPIYAVARLMADHKYGALPVVEDGNLVGIITITDLLNQMALIPMPTD